MSKKFHNKQRRIPTPKQSASRAKVDVVITTAGRFDCLETCLEAVYREAQLVPLNICILDNGTLAEERQAHSDLFQYHPENDPQKGVVEFRVKRLPKNMGFPIGADEGSRLGRSPLIMFLSDDVELHSGAVEKIVEDFNDSSIGIMGIKLLFPPTSADSNRPAGKVQHVGLALNIRGVPEHPLVGWSPENPKTNISRDAWAVTGACFTIRRELFNKVGGFDVIYGRGTYEDCDLCLKVRHLGFRIRVDTNATAYHYVGATAMKRQEPFPLQNNLQIFQGRWAQTGLLVYDQWIYY